MLDKFKVIIPLMVAVNSFRSSMAVSDQTRAALKGLGAIVHDDLHASPSSFSAVPGELKPDVVQASVDLRFLGLEKLTYNSGKPNEQTVERTYRRPPPPHVKGKEALPSGSESTPPHKSGPDAVAVIPLLFRPGMEPAIILIMQFRPPTGRYLVEFPAGLVNKGSTVADTATKELLEETGFGHDDHHVELQHVTGSTACHADVSASTVAYARVHIQDPHLAPPRPMNEEDEHIMRTLVVPLSKLSELESLVGPAAQLDGRLAGFLLGRKNVPRSQGSPMGTGGHFGF